MSVAGARHGHGHVSSLDSTHLFPDADFRVDIDAATHSSDASNNGQSYDSRAYGKASVFPAFIRKMQEATGKIVNLPEGYSYHDAEVQTLYLTESSRRHTDSRIEGMTPLNPNDPDGSLTAFYVQESTADAYFDTLMMMKCVFHSSKGVRSISMEDFPTEVLSSQELSSLLVRSF